VDGKRIIDLSMTVQEGMQTFAAHWHPFVEITQLGRHGIENRETRKITLGTHTGTHVDAPRHFIPNGATIDQLELHKTVGRATVLDFSSLPDGHEISLSDFQSVLKGRPVKKIICRFDWDVKALGRSLYYSDHPFFSEESCRWLIQNGCELIALDTPQPDNPINGRNSDNDAPNHQILLGGGAIIVEYLINLNQITKPEVDLVVAPLKILDGDGAPARCFALEEAME
jgi:arylformamidase